MSSASSDDKNIKERQQTEKGFRKKISDNRSVSSMSVHGASITTVSPDEERIRKEKKKNTLSDISITGNKITQELDNQSKNQRWVVALMEKKSM